MFFFLPVSIWVDLVLSRTGILCFTYRFITSIFFLLLHVFHISSTFRPRAYLFSSFLKESPRSSKKYVFSFTLSIFFVIINIAIFLTSSKHSRGIYFQLDLIIFSCLRRPFAYFLQCVFWQHNFLIFKLILIN